MTFTSPTMAMILSLDGRSGAVCVFKNGLLQHCQNLSLGVTDIIQDHQLARELQEQMKSVFVFSRSAADSKRPVLRIAASCGLDELSQIAEIIKEGPDDVSVEYINPQAVREQVGGGDSQNKELPLIACGLAMTEQDLPGFNSSLNLVSQESVAMHKTKRQLLSLAQAAVVIVVLSVAAIYPLKMRAQARETSTTLLAEKTKDSVLLVQKTTGIAKEIASLTEKRAVYDQAVQRLSDAQWVKILQATSEAVPEDVRIVQIVVTKSAEFEVTGEALQESGISRFVSNLQSKNLFESVRIEEIEFDHTEEEVPVVNYKIICKKRTMETGR